MKRKIIILAILLIAIVFILTSYIIWNSFVSKQDTGCLFPQPGDIESLYTELQITNTPQNISFISGYMNSYDIKTVRIHVIDYNADFYIVRNSGITFLPPSQINKTIKLKMCHIKQIEGYVANGELSLLDQLKLSVMYKQDGNK